MKRKLTPDGRANICGKKFPALRMQIGPEFSQRALADQMQLHGFDMSKNTIQCIESGERSVSDVELKGFSEIFGVSIEFLLSE